MVACKILASRACELATVEEMEVDLRARDFEFVKLCQAFILCMRKAGKIIPFERCWIPLGYKLLGFVTSIDGAKCGYGTTIHVLGEKESSGEEDTGLRRRLVMTDSKICKRTVPSNEALAGKLGSEALFTLLQPLLYDHGGAGLFSHSRVTAHAFLRC